MKLSYVKYMICALFIALSATTLHAQDEKTIAAQKATDEQLLQDYFTKNKIQPIKASGIYYTISKEGSGPNILAGQTVTIDYTGKFMDGTSFDSNIDPAFHHTDHLVFQVGIGRVIRGWDKGLLLLKKGTKATLYIPSGMAYGPASRGKMPANAILIFDVEVIDATK